MPLNASNRANDPLDREIGDELRPAEENISPFGERPKGGNFSSASPASPAKPFSRPNEENEPPPHRKRLIIQLINGPSGAVSDAMQREPQRGYKGTTKGHTKGRSPPGSKISENFIFQESWDAMPRPGWSPWWVQRRPQTIPGPTFEPLAERPATGPRPPRSPDKVRDLDGGTSAKGDLGASVVPAGARTVCNRKPALPVGERGASGALFLRRLCPWATPSIGSQKLSKIDER